MAHSMILYDSDEVEAIFYNGKAVKLSPCGANVILPVETTPNFHPVSQPKQLHQRTKFVTHQYRSQVQTTLDFRNRFGEKIFLCRELFESDTIMEYYADIKVVDWPTSTNAVVVNPDGALQLTSLDECATLTLAPNKQEFSVFFLCKLNSEQEYSQKTILSKTKSSEVSSTKLRRNVHSQRALKDISYKLNFNTEGNDKATQSNIDKRDTNVPDDTCCDSKPLDRHENLINYYVWQVQNHSVAQYPKTWKYPLGLLMTRAKIMQEAQDRKFTATPEDMKAEVEGCSSIQRNRSILPTSLPEKCPKSHLHKMYVEEKLVPQMVLSGDVDDVRVWNNRKRMKVIYSKGVIYRILWHPEPLLEIYPGNGSILKSMPGEGVYFNYFTMKEDKLQEQILSVRMPPPVNIRCGSHILASLLKRGSRLLSQMKLIDRNTHCQSEEVCWQDHQDIPVLPHNSLQLVEDCKIEGIGHFAAFTNGYLRIKFRDRTIIELQVDPCHNEGDACSEQHTKGTSKRQHQLFAENMCRILQPSGEEYMVDLKSSHDTNGEVGRELERLQQFNSDISSQEWTQKANQAYHSDVEMSGPTIRRLLERNLAKIQDIEDALKDS